MKILFLTSCLLLSCKLGFSQTIPETKKYIEDKIESNALRNHEYDVFFGDELIPHYFELITGENIKVEDQKRVFICETTLMNNGEPYFRVLEMFDIKGIRSINVGKQKASNGEIINVLKISLEDSYLVKTRVPRGKGIYKETPRRGIVEISIDLPVNELEALKKAFLHLCKAYGGNPLKENLF